MASQEADPAELPAACAGEAPGSLGEAAAEDSGAHRPVGRSQSHPEALQALGAVQILNAAVILALGGFMHSLQNLSYPSNYFFFSIVHTGYYIWGAIFFIVSGILSVLAGKKPTKTLLETSFGMHTASAVVALVGIVFLSMNLFAKDLLLKGCQSSWPPDLCIYMGASSTGLVSLMLILTLLELCIACSVAALWLKANCCHLRKLISRKSHKFFLDFSYLNYKLNMFLSTFFLYTFDFVLAYSQLTVLWQFQAISSLSNPGESRMPPNESKEIQS